MRKPFNIYLRLFLLFLAIGVIVAISIGLTRKQTNPKIPKVASFEYNDKTFNVYIKNIEVKGFDEFFIETSQLPKKQTDSIYAIRYHIYQDKFVRHSLQDDITIYPWSDDLLRGHPTDYVIEVFKNKLKDKAKDKEITNRFVNYLKQNIKDQ